MSSWKKICFIGKTNVIIRAGNEFTCHVLQYIIVYLEDMKNRLLVRICVAKGLATKKCNLPHARKCVHHGVF